MADDTATTPAAEPTDKPTPAPWSVRAGAFAVDVLPGAAVMTAMGLTALTVPLGSGWWWLCVALGGVAMVLTAANRALLPSITGWSLGRAVFGIAVERGAGEDGAVGPWRLLLRDVAHLLDTVPVLVGWLWPLWDERRRTFADLLTGTEVRPARLRRVPPRPSALAAVVALTAALVCILGGSVSYLVVYRHDRAVDRARAEVATQGPKIVEQMLSYKPESLQDDFARAQSLVTDGYREQLVTEQQAVQKAKPVANEYWVTNQSLLSVAPDRATMLLFLQGSRGEPGKERPISATVRVTFAKAAAVPWRVDDLTVVAKPLPAGGGN